MSNLDPILRRRSNKSALRPGTESVALAVGMQVALELWDKNRRKWLAQLEALRNEFRILAAKRALELPDRNHRRKADRLPTTSNIAFLGLDRQALFVALDQAGIACSTGSACASGSSEPSPVHIAMGCRPGRNFERAPLQLRCSNDTCRGRRIESSASSESATTCEAENKAENRFPWLPFGPQIG